MITKTPRKNGAFFIGVFAYNKNICSIMEANKVGKELQRAISQKQQMKIIYFGSNEQTTQHAV